MKTVVKEEKKGSRIRQTFTRCPDCGKNEGFYVFLVNKNGGKPSEFGVRLACPKCRRIYQIGLIVEETAKKAVGRK